MKFVKLPMQSCQQRTAQAACSCAFVAAGIDKIRGPRLSAECNDNIQLCSPAPAADVNKARDDTKQQGIRKYDGLQWRGGPM